VQLAVLIEATAGRKSEHGLCTEPNSAESDSEQGLRTEPTSAECNSKQGLRTEPNSAGHDQGLHAGSAVSVTGASAPYPNCWYRTWESTYTGSVGEFACAARVYWLC
jgi:hypothetical protein